MKLTHEDIMTVLREKIADLLPLPEVKIKRIVSDASGDEQEAICLFSDLQVGHLTPSTNAKVLRERARIYARKIKQVIDLQRHFCPIKRIWVLVLGDMLQGELIEKFVSLDELEMVVGKQYPIASDILAEFVQTLAQYFEEVKVHCVRGNHGKTQPMAATITNWDLVIYERTAALLKNQPNVEFIVTEQFYEVVKVMGWKVLLTHGDSIPMYLNIPLYGLTMRSMRWQGSIGKFHYMFVGHFHNPTFINWNECQIFVNGAFVSEDQWVLQKLGFSTEPAQWLFLIHPRVGISSQHLIYLSERRKR